MTRKHGTNDMRETLSLKPRPPFGAASLRFVSLAAAFAMLFMLSCQSPDPIAKEKQRPLTPDERYLVEYYMKIMEFEKSLHDNPALREEQRRELELKIDKERIRRTLVALEKEPERWLAIYNRINELQLRALQNAPTEKY